MSRGIKQYRVLIWLRFLSAFNPTFVSRIRLLKMPSFRKRHIERWTAQNSFSTWHLAVERKWERRSRPNWYLNLRRHPRGASNDSRWPRWTKIQVKGRSHDQPCTCFCNQSPAITISRTCLKVRALSVKRMKIAPSFCLWGERPCFHALWFKITPSLRLWEERW